MVVQNVKGSLVGGTQDIAAKPARILTATPLPQSSSSEVSDQLEVNTSQPTDTHQHLSRINKAIEAVNVASGAVDEISKIVDGIEGIIEQVDSGDLPPAHVAKLEKEALGLRDEISRVAQSATSDGVKPLAGDSIRVELEQTLGRALEVILPDDASNAFGLNNIKFSPKDLILSTAAKVEEARRGIEALRSKLSKGSDSIRSTVAELEVASQNQEASRATVRDVDLASQLASETKGGIQKDPAGALGSVGNIFKNAKDLLEST